MSVVEAVQETLVAGQADTRREVSELGEKVAVVAAKQTTSENGYYTIAGYASLLGRRVDLTAAKALGGRAKALSTKLGILVDQMKDARFGKVNLYHEDVLALVFGAQPARLVA